MPDLGMTQQTPEVTGQPQAPLPEMRDEALRRFVAATSGDGGGRAGRELAAWAAEDAARRREVEELERLSADARALADHYPLAVRHRAAAPWRRFRLAAVGLTLGAVCAVAVLMAPPRTVSADGGRTALLELGNGIRAHLDSGAELQVPRQPWDHSVRLMRGDVVFDVVHDDARPFVVHTATAAIADVGTRFLVRSGDGRVAVAVFEGEVEVSPARGGGARVGARQAVEVVAGGVLRSLPPPDEEVDTAWRHGRIVFKNHTLAEVAASLSRYSPRPVVVGSPVIAGLRVSGTFGLGATADAVRALEQVLPVRAVQRPDATVLEPVASGPLSPPRPRR